MPVYKDVCPGYRVGDDGSVQVYRDGKWHELHKRMSRYGDWDVRINRDGKRHMARVHKLVLRAFLGPRPRGYTPARRNGDPFDNRASNLFYKRVGVKV